MFLYAFDIKELKKIFFIINRNITFSLINRKQIIFNKFYSYVNLKIYIVIVI